MIVMVGATALLEDFSGLDFGIDDLLIVEPPGAVLTIHPGRPAPPTGIGFILLGLALFLLDRRSAHGWHPSEILALLQGLMCYVVIFGYIYGVQTLYMMSPQFTGMALNTAILLAMSTIGVLFCRPDRGLMAIVSDISPGGTMARVLLPPALILPAILEILLSLPVLSQTDSWAPKWDASVARHSVLVSVITFLMVAMTARMLAKLDQRRCVAETSLKEANAALHNKARELEATNSELDAFAYAVSHDLRGPLRAMRGFSQALLEDAAPKLAPDELEYLHHIGQAGERMGQLMDGLLTLSHRMRGEMNRETVNISSMAENLITEIAGADPTRSVTWIIEPGLSADGDPRLIELLLCNLLSNARKYTAKTGAARVTLSAWEEVVQGNPRRWFTVADNGVGFDISHVDRLFRPFQRLHRQDEFPGLGLGLATVQRIVRRHGGQLRTEAALGEGARFSFTLSSAADPELLNPKFPEKAAPGTLPASPSTLSNSSVGPISMNLCIREQNDGRSHQYPPP